MDEKEWERMSEFDKFATHLGMSVWVGIIALDKLARKKRSVLVKEDKEWLLSFCPRFFADTKLRRFKDKKYQPGEDLVKAWDLTRKYGEHLPSFMVEDICQIQSCLRRLKSEMEKRIETGKE